MKKCYDCTHVEMCGWRKEVEEQGCEFFGDGIGWIAVSEALPSKGQVVLAIGDKGTWDVGKFQGTAGLTDDERMWNWKKKTVKYVEYWMPKDAIPLPNREDGEA